MLRALAETGEELYRHQIKEPFDEAGHAVFRLAKAARPMGNLDLADAISACRRQHRDKAVQLAIKSNLTENSGAVTFHAAVVIVQSHASEPTYYPIEDSTWPNFVPWIVPHSLPAADHVETGVQCRQKTRNFARIILQIAVERDNDLAARRSETSRQRRRFAEITPQANA